MSLDDIKRTMEGVGELDLNKPAIEILTELVAIMDAKKKDWMQVGFVDEFNEQIILEINICARSMYDDSDGGSGSA